MPDIISAHLSNKMKVPVLIDDMHMNWNSIDIQKVEVSNLPNSMLSKAFSAEQILIEAPITAYLSRDIVLERVELDDVYVGLEFESKSSSRGNWTSILGNMQTSSESSKKTSRKTVLIKKLILTNIDVSLAYRQNAKSIKRLSPIKRLEFTNVSSEQGIPYEKISQIIFEQMLKSIFSLEGLQNMLDSILQIPTAPIDKILQPFKGLINENMLDSEESF